MLTFAPPLVAAAIPDHPSLIESIGFQINGLIVVFTALSVIWLVLEISGAYFRRAAKAAKAAPATAPAPAAPTIPEVAAGLAPEIAAAITVAVHVTLGERARIQAIVPVGSQVWAREGRRQIFSSHQPR